MLPAMATASGRNHHICTLLLAAAVSAAGLCGCNTTTEEMFRADEPQQQGKGNPLSKAGAKDQEQRQRDCWDMPSAQACYEVGLAHELGLSTEVNLVEAQRYYDKACGLDHNEEHCEAAERLKKKQK